MQAEPEVSILSAAVANEDRSDPRKDWMPYSWVASAVMVCRHHSWRDRKGCVVRDSPARSEPHRFLEGYLYGLLDDIDNYFD